MKPFSSCHLYTFVDTAYLHGRDPGEIARQLCDGGSDLIQLRAKGAPLDEIRRLAEAVLPVCERAGVGFVLNDHPKLALQLGAHICHLGQEDFFDAGFTHSDQVRNAECGVRNENITVGHSSSPLRTPHYALRIGLSTHAPDQAQRALRAAPDYLAIGPVFPTGTKPGRPPATLDYVRWAAAHVTIPWFAIGGINLDTLDSVLAAGARRICVVSAILNAPDIAAACRAVRARIEQHGQ